MSKVDLSIVIPVYNLEQYIEQCVESIFPVKKAGIEILLVDDGSIDHSSEICDRLASDYKEIRVIHKKNGGAADCRNAGMRAAQGDYIMFVDGDDFLPQGAVDIISANLKPNIQVLTFDYYEYYDESDIRKLCHISANSIIDAFGQVSMDVFAKISPLPMPWLYVVSREYIEKHNIYMHAGLLDEDEEWTARLFASVSDVKILHEYLYYYRRNRANSLTFDRKVANTLADIEIIKLLQKEIANGEYSAAGTYVLENKCRQMINKVLDDLPRLTENDKTIIMREITRYRTLLKKGTTLDKMHYYIDPILGRERVVGLARLLTYLKNGR